MVEVEAILCWETEAGGAVEDEVGVEVACCNAAAAAIDDLEGEGRLRSRVTESEAGLSAAEE